MATTIVDFRVDDRVDRAVDGKTNYDVEHRGKVTVDGDVDR